MAPFFYSRHGRISKFFPVGVKRHPRQLSRIKGRSFRGALHTGDAGRRVFFTEIRNGLFVQLQ